MRIRFRLRNTAAAAMAAAALGVGLWGSPTVQASDHSESPFVQADAAQDITDVYVFQSREDASNTVIIVCWAGLSVDPDHAQGLGEPASTEGLYDPAALYAINIDNDMDHAADIRIYWRYGTNADGDVGIQWTSLPDTEEPVVHAVESVYEDPVSGARLLSGHADDPFFFDAAGYLTTLDTGMLSITSTSDTLAGLNVTAAAIEIPTAKLGDGPFQVWATASRKGG